MEKSGVIFPCFMLQYNDRWKIFHNIIVIGWKVFHLSTLFDTITTHRVSQKGERKNANRKSDGNP